MEEEIKLPPKWTVKQDFAVGFTYYDEKGKIALQNPKDSNSIRKFCWAIYNKIEGK